MASELGLDEDIVIVDPDHPGAKNRFIYTGGVVQAVPTSVAAILKNALSSPSTTVNLARVLLKAVLFEVVPIVGDNLTRCSHFDTSASTPMKRLTNQYIPL